MTTVTAEDMAILEALKGLREVGRLTGAKHDTPGAPITTGFSHGDQGIFSLAGPNPRVWSTITGTTSLGTKLPSFSSVDTNPLRSVLTGVTAASGEEKTAVCDDAQVAGLRKTGAFSHTFGLKEYATREIWLDRIGQRVNRSEPMDLFLQNRPDIGTPPIAPTLGANPRDLLNSEIQGKLFELQMAFVHFLAAQVWTGDPTNNVGTYPNLAYGEFNGLQILVNTGYQDAVSAQAVPSVDSDVKDFGGGRVDLSGSTLVNYLTYMTRYLRWRAETSGIGGSVEWAFVMRPSLFWELTDVWPCAYNTYRCSTSLDADTDRQFVDAASQRRFADDMRQGNYLLVDGIRYPVILDAYMPETQPVGGVFESDIYLLPLRVMGVPTLYWEFFNEGNAELSAFLSTIPGEAIKVTDGGAYIIWSKRTNLCYQLQAKTMLRLILETPWLAGRLNDVRYSPLQHEIEPDPSAGYHLNGGLTSRPGPSYYAIRSA